MRLALLLTALLVAAGCRDRSQDPGVPGLVRLGYLPNVTHAQALTGVHSGRFAKALGSASLEATSFSAGPALIEALFAGEIDVAYLGPSPALNAFVRSKGRALRLIGGAARGGARLVARREIGLSGAQGLRGLRIGVPQIGNTQDVVCRAWLAAKGLESADRGGDVHVYPLAAADILALMVRKELDAAFVPEPWGARLVAEADAEPYPADDGPSDPNVPTTILVARNAFLTARPEDVKLLLAAHRAETAWHATAPEARSVINDAMAEELGKRLPDAVLDDAMASIVLTDEVLMEPLDALAEAAFAIGYLPDRNITGILAPPKL